MRALLVATVCCGMLPLPVLAQRTSIHVGGGGGRMGSFGNSGLPPLAPIPPLGLSNPVFSSGRDFGQFSRFGEFSRFGQFPRFGHRGGLGGFAFGYPWFFGGYDGGYESASPGVFIVMPPATGAAPEPPPPSAEKPRPEIHEYSHPDSTSNASAVFSIIGKDGSNRSAAAVWVQDDLVRYVTADGGSGQIPLSAIDRAATQKANAGKNLTLSLPPSNEPG